MTASGAMLPPSAGAGRPNVVMRSRDDMPLVAETLRMLGRQSVACELIVFDNDSTDGTLEEVRRHTDRVHRVPRGSYVPGAVLNRAMEVASGEIVVFLNSDCIPADETWLERLLAGFDRHRLDNGPDFVERTARLSSDERLHQCRSDSTTLHGSGTRHCGFDARDVAAVFGRQIPRPGCSPLHALDILETFGDGDGSDRQDLWRSCFSMAASALRRSAWEAHRFDETLRYSEDIDLTWRLRSHGHAIRYVADAVVLHSHDYSLEEAYRRQLGEGCAEASIFPWSPWRRSLVRYSVLPYLRKVASDWRHLVPRGELAWAARAPGLRLVQAVGRRRGFTQGLRGAT